jgi:hypothetical protein
LNPSAKGTYAELIVSAYYLSRGAEVYRAVNPSAPFDLAVYEAGMFTKVEVRLGRLRPNWRVGGGESVVGFGGLPGAPAYDLLAVVHNGRLMLLRCEDEACGKRYVYLSRFEAEAVSLDVLAGPEVDLSPSSSENGF